VFTFVLTSIMGGCSNAEGASYLVENSVVTSVVAFLKKPVTNSGMTVAIQTLYNLTRSDEGQLQVRVAHPRRPVSLIMW
jgi:hypothetical protein